MKRCKRSDFTNERDWEQCLIESGASSLEQLDIARVDLVSRPATGRQFILYKSEKEGKPKESMKEMKTMENLTGILMDVGIEADKIDKAMEKWEALEDVRKDDKDLVSQLRSLVEGLEDETLRTGLQSLLAGYGAGEPIAKSAYDEIETIARTLFDSGQEKSLPEARGAAWKRRPDLLSKSQGALPSVQEIFKNLVVPISETDADKLRSIVTQLKTIGGENPTLPTGKICNLISYWLDKVVGMQNTQREIDALNARMQAAVAGVAEGVDGKVVPKVPVSFSKSKSINPVEYAAKYKELIGLS